MKLDKNCVCFLVSLTMFTSEIILKYMINRKPCKSLLISILLGDTGNTLEWLGKPRHFPHWVWVSSDQLDIKIHYHGILHTAIQVYMYTIKINGYTSVFPDLFYQRKTYFASQGDQNLPSGRAESAGAY